MKWCSILGRKSTLKPSSVVSDRSEIDCDYVLSLIHILHLQLFLAVLAKPRMIQFKKDITT